MTQVKCDNCEWTGDQCETEEIADFWSRVDVGGEVPAGDCPKCGAFAYLVKPATVPPSSAARDWRLVLQDLVWSAEYDLRPLGKCGPTKTQAVADGRELLADTSSVPPASTPEVAQPFTVLLLQPDDYWDGHESDWILREYVNAASVEEALGLAQDAAWQRRKAEQAKPEDVDDAEDERREAERYAVLAVYSGHITDIFQA